MTKYKNPREEQERIATEEMNRQDEIMKEPANNVEDETWKKRYADLRRHSDQQKAQLSQREEELQRKLDMALRGQIKAPKSEEDVEEWVKKYPEFAGILETIVQTRIKEATSSTQEKLVVIEQQQRELEVEKARIALKKLHPDFDELVKSTEFHEWLSNQKQADQDSIYKKLDIDDADFVISKYKARKGASKSKVDDDDYSGGGAAKVVRKSQGASLPDEDYGDFKYSESQIARESKKNPSWFAKNEKDIMDALRAGKVLMDLSGGAR